MNRVDSKHWIAFYFFFFFSSAIFSTSDRGENNLPVDLQRTLLVKRESDHSLAFLTSVQDIHFICKRVWWERSSRNREKESSVPLNQLEMQLEQRADETWREFDEKYSHVCEHARRRRRSYREKKTCFTCRVKRETQQFVITRVNSLHRERETHTGDDDSAEDRWKDEFAWAAIKMRGKITLCKQWTDDFDESDFNGKKCASKNVDLSVRSKSQLDGDKQQQQQWRLKKKVTHGEVKRSDKSCHLITWVEWREEVTS